MATATVPMNAAQSVPIPSANGSIQLKDTAEQRVQYVLDDLVTKSKWYVIFTEMNGKEDFVSQERGSCNQEVCWHPHHPSPRERLAARELMAQGKARSGWRTTLTLDDEILTTITTLGPFPQCIHAAKHEFRSLVVDPSNADHVSLAAELQQHLQSLDDAIAKVYELFEQHREYRARATELGVVRS